MDDITANMCQFGKGRIGTSSQVLRFAYAIENCVQESEVPGPDGDILGVVEGWEDDETHNPKVAAISHTRGLTLFFFVPFKELSITTVELRVSEVVTMVDNDCGVRVSVVVVNNDGRVT
ncbi:F-box protein 7 [Artemisia annua]|uniref:F-box protein 7 n=1 Tax=Artemisia annua TaxID=35608 RepID=A0A2U1PTZ0_ARTAN|nr:F-box protein 7 [Artemisia annua]